MIELTPAEELIVNDTRITIRDVPLHKDGYNPMGTVAYFQRTNGESALQSLRIQGSSVIVEFSDIRFPDGGDLGISVVGHYPKENDPTRTHYYAVCTLLHGNERLEAIDLRTSPNGSIIYQTVESGPIAQVQQSVQRADTLIHLLSQRHIPILHIYPGSTTDVLVSSHNQPYHFTIFDVNRSSGGNTVHFSEIRFDDGQEYVFDSGMEHELSINGQRVCTLTSGRGHIYNRNRNGNG